MAIAFLCLCVYVCPQLYRLALCRAYLLSSSRLCLMSVRISTASDLEEYGFIGFVLQGRDETGAVQGVFDAEASSEGVQAFRCSSDNDTVTHRKASAKQSIDLVWSAHKDRCSSSDVYFR